MPANDVEEWFVEGSWRNAHESLVLAHRLVESAVTRESAEIASQRTRVAEDDEALFEEHFHFVDAPAAVLRTALFCQAVAAFEYNLLLLCVVGTRIIAGAEYDHVREDRREIAKNRLRHLGDLTGSDFLQSASIDSLLRLRNIATHAANGLMLLHSRADEPQEATRLRGIEEWVQRNPELMSTSGFSLCPTTAFVPHVIEVFDELMGRILRRLKTMAGN